MPENVKCTNFSFKLEKDILKICFHVTDYEWVLRSDFSETSCV